MLCFGSCCCCGVLVVCVQTVGCQKCLAGILIYLVVIVDPVPLKPGM